MKADVASTAYYTLLTLVEVEIQLAATVKYLEVQLDSKVMWTDIQEQYQKSRRLLWCCRIMTMGSLDVDIRSF